MVQPTADVLVIDDEDGVRKALCRIVARAGHSAHGAASAEEADAALRVQPYDVILLDLQMPGTGGLEYLRALKRRGCPSEVIVVTGYPTPDAVRDALQLGAYDFMAKPPHAELLVAKIGHVLQVHETRCLRQGIASIRSVVSECMASVATSDHASAGAGNATGGVPLHQQLSARQYQAMCGIASGKTPKQTAGDLGLSVKTARAHLRAARRKMRMSCDAELIRYAVKHGLVE